MRKSIALSVLNTVKDLNKSGLVDNITMKNIEKLCLPEIKEYTPDKIIFIRKKFKLSQAALASVFNISPSTVQKWERGYKNRLALQENYYILWKRKVYKR
jgi:putative transcriptional regulator